MEGETVAIVVGICIVAAAILWIARAKRLRFERQADTLVVHVKDRQPRVEERDGGAIIYFDGKRIEIRPEWRFAPPELIVTRWKTGGEAFLSIKADDRLLYQGTKADGEQVLADVRKYLR